MNRAVIRIRVSLLAAAILAVSAPPVTGGGPRAVNGLGQPMAWDTASAVVYNPDLGPLGILSNTQARTLLAEAFAEWGAGPADITFAEGAALQEDVNAAGTRSSNTAHYRNFYRVTGDSRSPVIFDADGSIIDALFGAGARFEVLGAAGIDAPPGIVTEITEASIIINGVFFDGLGPPSSPPDLTRQGFKAAMVHEIGHFINLDHSVLNQELAFDGNAGNDVYVPTMFPLVVDGEDALATTNPDDRLAAQNLYPAGAAIDSIGGRVRFGGVPLQGANVVLRKTDDPWMTSYSLISGGLFFPCNAGSTCDPCATACDPGNPPEQGAFAADFFAPGQYRICVEQIDTRFSVPNSNFVGPLATPKILPGPEECYNAAEGGAADDDPDEASNVTAGGGTFVDLQLNALPLEDFYEPNNNLASGATLDDLPAGKDTAAGHMAPGDLDVFNVAVTAGQRVWIDVDSAELGSQLDLVLGFYDASNALVARVDDAFDPDSQGFSFDPAFELTAGFSGTAKVVVSSYPDLDQDGVGGGTVFGGYWLRVEVATDTDGDGATDGADICPATAKDDVDRDGLCFGADNCPTLANPSQAPSIPISGPMIATGDVTATLISPGGATVVFRADKETDEVFELYATPLLGGSWTKLSGTLVASGDVTPSFAVSPDSAMAVFMADREIDEVVELYAVPLGGGPPAKLNAGLVANGDVASFAISSTTARVAYQADGDVDERVELYSVSIGGGAATKLNGALPSTGDVTSYVLSPDGTRAIFLADTSVDQQFELYGAPIAGGGATKLNGTLVAGGSVSSFLVSANSAHVVYLADQEVDQRIELYSAPISGGPVTKLNGTLLSGVVGEYQITPDSQTVVYLASQGAGDPIWKVPIAGGTPVGLGNGQPAFDLAISADATRVVFRDNPNTCSSSQTNLFSVPVTPGPPTQLTSYAGADVVGVTKFKISSDSSWVVYQYQGCCFSCGTGSLHDVPIDGGVPSSLQQGSAGGGSIQSDWSITPDGTRAVYRAWNANFTPIRLRASPLQTGIATIVSGPMVNGRDASSGYAIAPDSVSAVYFSDELTNDLFELFNAHFVPDVDSDGVLAVCDTCPNVSNPNQDDADGNGVGDACQSCGAGTDPDADAVCGAADNCPTVPNAGQADFDADGAGNACDADDDDDGLVDSVETDTGVFVNENNTGTDPLDADSDNDGVSDGDEVLRGTDPNGSAAGPAAPFVGKSVVSAAADGANSVFAADLDADGDLDVRSASSGDNKIAWYENDGVSPLGWTPHTISTAAILASSVFAADVDGDGDVDALSASFGDERVTWYENDGTPAVGAWTEHAIGIAVDTTSVFAADVDGDGDVDAFAASSFNDEVTWYENDGTPAVGVWTAHAISATADGAWSVFAADVDGDGDLDALSASELDDKVAWYENDGTPAVGPWAEHAITTAAAGAQSVFAADVDGDGDLDALSASQDDDKVAWYENDGTPAVGTWTAHTISTTADGGESVYATDLDGDGDVDALSAASTGSEVAWYENDGASPPGWTERTITTAADSARSVLAADVDGDGDTDILSASQNDDTVGWYENRTIHRSAAFPVVRTINTTSQSGALSVFAADIDGDGDLDAMSASQFDDTIAWYQNDGAPVPAWTEREIVSGVTANGAMAVFAADVNGDGHMDTLSASRFSNTIAWYQNDGATPVPGWTERDISSAANGASSVFAADLNRDGNLDVLSASSSDNKIAWYQNDGATPVPGWTPRTISTAAFGAAAVFAADVNGDGNLDVLSASSSDSDIDWYQNDGTTPVPGFTPRAIDVGAGGVVSIFAADVDGDGDVDVLSATQIDNRIGWYDNNGAAVPVWTPRTIATLPPEGLPTAVHARDVDGDGDLDVLSASDLDDTIAWYENDGQIPPGWTAHTVTSAADGAASVFAADVDADGDVDVLSASQTDNRIAWYENRGGQFAMATTAQAPANMSDGSAAAVLTIDARSNGRPADNAIELATIELQVTDGSGSSLSSDEANALIERLRLYVDDGSGTFDPLTDTVVVTVEELALSPQLMELTLGDPRVRLAPGQENRFFVVAETTPGASSWSPNSFRVTHVTESSSKARDAVTGDLLRMEFAQNVSTTTVTASGDPTPPFVTGVFPADGTVDVAPSTDVVLFLSEPVDPQSLETGVSLSINEMKVPGAISVSADGRLVSFDPESPLALGADFVVRVTGALRDRARNAAIPFSAMFEVTSNAGVGDVGAGEFGEGAGGRSLEGTNANDNSGFATAALEDVNGTAASNGIADLVIGAPNADAGGVDAGKATLVFGAPGLQSNAGAVTSLTYRTATAGDFVGDSVERAGDMNGDGVQDFLIGAPRSDQAGTDAGTVYLVFGDPGLDEAAPGPFDLDNLAACATATLCGVRFLGQTAGDLAGASLSWAGDVNADGVDDIFIGAPGANPGGRAEAGKAYLIYGPLGPGTILLSSVGASTPGLVFHGESAGDRLGESVSDWQAHQGGDGIDDLLLGAPGATALDEYGTPIPSAGFVYAIQGGTGPGRLDDTGSPGVIELARVANGGPDQVAGMVFLGAMSNGNLGRSLTGAVDTNGDGIHDVLLAGNGLAFVIPGDGPKVVIGNTRTGGTRTAAQTLRALGDLDAMEDLGALRFVAGDDDPLTIGPAGDLDNDGFEDFIVGAPLADGTGGPDSGRAFVIFGSPAAIGGDRDLADVGATVAGFVVEGAEAGDNLGASVGGGQDLNADGVDDGLVGAPFADTAPGTQPDAGETYVISPIRPDEVVQVRLEKLGGVSARLEWTVPDLAATYNIYRGSLSTLQAAGAVRTSDMTQLACAISFDADADQLPDADDAAPPPPPGDAFVYLVTARNFQGEGPLGPVGARPPRVNDAQCP